MTAQDVIAGLVAQGVIPPEYRLAAERELDRELERRARRVSQTLAAMVSFHQLAVRCAEFVI